MQLWLSSLFCQLSCSPEHPRVLAPIERIKSLTDSVGFFLDILLSVYIYILKNCFFCVHMLEKSQVSIGKGNARKDERIFQSGNAPVAVSQLLHVPSPTAAACPPTAPLPLAALRCSCSCSGTLPALRPRDSAYSVDGRWKTSAASGSDSAHEGAAGEGTQVTGWL